jgi:mRNA interferase RelE/StbE
MERVLTQPDPRNLAKRLQGNDGDEWRFRVGNHRVICAFIDHELILVLRLGHRREVYR